MSSSAGMRTRLETAEFLTRSRVLIVAGKGGVGKTVVAGAVARAAAMAGQRVTVVEIDGKTGLAASFGLERQLGYDESVLVPGTDGECDVVARTITPDDALLEYLSDHGFGRISDRLVRIGAVDVAASAAPGIKDILILGKVKQLAASGETDLVVFDAPAAGHAISILRSPLGLLDSVTSGPIHDQAAEVAELLGDGERARVMLVTLPEETPVNELVDTAFELEDQVGVALAPVVVNSVWPVRSGLDADPGKLAAAAGVDVSDSDLAAMAEAAAFRSTRQQRQGEEIERLANLLPLPQLHLSRRFVGDLGPTDMDALAGELTQQISAMDEGAVP